MKTIEEIVDGTLTAGGRHVWIEKSYDRIRKPINWAHRQKP